MKNSLLFLIVIGLFTNCSNQNSDYNCVEREVAFVTSVHAPNSGIVNENIEIEVNFNIP